MPRHRSTQVSLEATPYYHCVSRCVRRAYLCGINYNTNENYEHRRAWVEQELLYQAQVFAIDIATYAIMSNHYHVVVHINKKQADAWDFDTVIERWHALFKYSYLGCLFNATDNRHTKKPAAAGFYFEHKPCCDRWPTHHTTDF